MKNYLFVHFRETTSPEGEQVYFAISRDGFHWESLNEGRPILWAYYGDHGVRDMTIIRDRKTGRFHIFATDLSLSYGMRGKYKHSWAEIGLHGSKDLAHWYSDDLVHWSEEEMVTLGDEDFGCLWAPDILYDKEHDDYILHWSSPHRSNNLGAKAIYCSRATDFVHFTKPELLCRKEDSGVIDSAMYEENGQYYLFVKSEGNPEKLILLKSRSVTGPFERVAAFDESMADCQAGLYEAPTAVQLEDGRWCLFIDYYGVRGRGQGYIPYTADTLSDGRFLRVSASRADSCADHSDAFSFPYGFKHGTILPITQQEYERIRTHDWQEDQFEKNP